MQLSAFQPFINGTQVNLSQAKPLNQMSFSPVDLKPTSPSLSMLKAGMIGQETLNTHSENHCNDFEKHDSTHPSDMSEKRYETQSPEAILDRQERKRPYANPREEQRAAWRDSFNSQSEEQKAIKCQNLAKEIKQLRRKIRTFDSKVSSTRGTLKADKSERTKIFRAVADKIKNSMKLSLEDQKDALRNLLQIIVEGRMSLASLQFKQLCTIVRSQLSDQEIHQSANLQKDRAAFIYLPEKRVVVSQSEISAYSKMNCSGDILRAITGNGEMKSMMALTAPVINFNNVPSLQYDTNLQHIAQNYCLCSLNHHNMNRQGQQQSKQLYNAL